MNEDFADVLRCLFEQGAEFVVVGAHALAVHGVARATGDLDVFVNPTPENAARVYAALEGFGAPLATHGVRAQDFALPGTIYQLGLPPRRIDVITAIDGVAFEEARQDRVEHAVADLRVPFLGRATLERNKRAAGRPKDLADLALLAEVGGAPTPKKGRRRPPKG